MMRVITRTATTSGPDARAHEQFAEYLRQRGLADSTADAIADSYFTGKLRRRRKLPTPTSAAALVEQLQLADLRAGREPVESATAREVERRRAEMRMAEERSRPGTRQVQP